MIVVFVMVIIKTKMSVGVLWFRFRLGGCDNPVVDDCGICGGNNKDKDEEFVLVIIKVLKSCFNKFKLFIILIQQKNWI